MENYLHTGRLSGDKEGPGERGAVLQGGLRLFRLEQERHHSHQVGKHHCHSKWRPDVDYSRDSKKLIESTFKSTSGFLPQWSSVCDEEGWTEPHRCGGLLRRNINFLKISVFLLRDVIYTHPLPCLKVQDMVNKIDDGSGVLDFEDFLLVNKDWLNSNVCTSMCWEYIVFILSIHGWPEVITVDARRKWWRHLWTAPKQDSWNPMCALLTKHNWPVTGILASAR